MPGAASGPRAAPGQSSWALAHEPRFTRKTGAEVECWPLHHGGSASWCGRELGSLPPVAGAARPIRCRPASPGQSSFRAFSAESSGGTPQPPGAEFARARHQAIQRNCHHQYELSHERPFIGRSFIALSFLGPNARGLSVFGRPVLPPIGLLRPCEPVDTVNRVRSPPRVLGGSPRRRVAVHADVLDREAHRPAGGQSAGDLALARGASGRGQCAGGVSYRPARTRTGCAGGRGSRRRPNRPPRARSDGDSWPWDWRYWDTK